MNERRDGEWAEEVRAMAGAFPYPPTPDVATVVQRRLAVEAAPARRHRRRLAWGAAVALGLLALAGGLLAVPQVRAAVLEALNLGAIRILLGEPPPSPRQATAEAAPTVLPSVLDLAGETTLSEAEAQAGFPVRLPAYPADLGPPDQVFYQRMGGPVVVLVWTEPAQPDKVRLSLHQLGPGTFGEKVQPPVVEETAVGGRLALWTEGPYLLVMQNGTLAAQRLVEGHVLVWAEGEVTYRLETDLDLEEAIRIAESLR